MGHECVFATDIDAHAAAVYEMNWGQPNGSPVHCDIRKVIDVIISNKISGAPVVDQNKQLVGIISEKDCLRVIVEDIYHNLPPNKGMVSNYMSRKVVTVNEDTYVTEAANLFLNSNFRRYPVVSNNKMVGLVSRRDILRASKRIKKTSWY